MKRLKEIKAGGENSPRSPAVCFRSRPWRRCGTFRAAALTGRFQKTLGEPGKPCRPAPHASVRANTFGPLPPTPPPPPSPAAFSHHVFTLEAEGRLRIEPAPWGGPARPRPVALTRMKRRGFASGSRLSSMGLFGLVKLSPPWTNTPSNQSIHTSSVLCVCFFFIQYEGKCWSHSSRWSFCQEICVFYRYPSKRSAQP